ncbi:MAG TPA: hypothetical protein VGL93_14495 [Streptosporangiaceae bacterium]|jgi:hypothetical protein
MTGFIVFTLLALVGLAMVTTYLWNEVAVLRERDASRRIDDLTHKAISDIATIQQRTEDQMRRFREVR